MDPKTFFTSPQNTVQKQYEALRAFYTGQCSAKEAAKRFDYTINSFYSNRENPALWTGSEFKGFAI